MQETYFKIQNCALEFSISMVKQNVQDKYSGKWWIWIDVDGDSEKLDTVTEPQKWYFELANKLNDEQQEKGFSINASW